ncbi:MAG: class I SAM-dependent methyltransferase [FCB group bacterium]
MTWEEAVLWLREHKDMQELVRDSYFDDPLLVSAQRFYNSTEWKEVQRILSDLSKGKVLDIGAGRGISSYALTKDGWDVTALEPDKSEIVGTGAITKLFEEAHLSIKIVESFGEELPFADAAFDFVNARQVLHHANDLEKLCSEIYRVLKPNGMLLASREHVLSKKEDLNSFLESHPLHKFYGGENAYTLTEYMNALDKAGFIEARILETYDSDINLFPSSKEEILKSIKQKIRFNPPNFLFNLYLRRLNKKNNVAGRLFSFICKK